MHTRDLLYLLHIILVSSETGRSVLTRTELGAGRHRTSRIGPLFVASGRTYLKTCPTRGRRYPLSSKYLTFQTGATSHGAAALRPCWMRHTSP